VFSLKKILYKIFVNNRVIDFIGSPIMSIIVPPLEALYYGTLDIWGDDWNIVKNHKSIHEIAFTILASLTVLILFIKGISEQFKGSVLKKYQNLLESLVVFFNELVKKKRDRFFQKAKGVKPNADIFKLITHPKDQLDFVLDGTKRLLSNGFDIDPKNVGITIIQGIPDDSKWWYEFKCDSQKQHTKAKIIMGGNSAANYCYESGESLFIPDIRKGIKENVFLASERSKKSGYGSIYCKPVRINVNSIIYVYIFTIVVYGEFLCTPYDEDECKACERLLDEVADRVELELYLHSMKQFKISGGKAA
jgi:hypothetical protein